MPYITDRRQLSYPCDMPSGNRHLLKPAYYLALQLRGLASQPQRQAYGSMQSIVKCIWAHTLMEMIERQSREGLKRVSTRQDMACVMEYFVRPGVR